MGEVEFKPITRMYCLECLADLTELSEPSRYVGFCPNCLAKNLKDEKLAVYIRSRLSEYEELWT